MSNVWVRAWRNTPQYNCGLCGRSTCSAFARAYLAGDLELDACPIMQMAEFVNFRTTLEIMRTREQVVSLRPAPERSPEGISFLQPCKDNIERVTGMFRVYNGVPEGQSMRFGGFDPLVLCDLLDNLSDQFTFIKCSRELGYARADRGEMNITVLQDGRVNLRQVPDETTAYTLAASLERVLMGALICDCCGCDLLSVLVDCTNTEENHPVLDAGLRASLDRTIIKKPFSAAVLSTTFGDYSSEIITLFEQVFLRFEELVDKIIQGKRSSSKEDFIESYRVLLDYLMKESDSKSMTLLLKGLGILRVIENAIVGLVNLSYETPMHSSEIPQIQSILRTMLTNPSIDLTETPLPPNTIANLARVQRAIHLLTLWNTS
ncbi:MAG: (Fe-S)-binding protein [Candidatus Thorarchaeota archaeon]